MGLQHPTEPDVRAVAEHDEAAHRRQILTYLAITTALAALVVLLLLSL
ncbi:hypothetical protein [Gordonia bronchialis]|nr:hypothetical protein [Gordonia bronchialis]